MCCPWRNARLHWAKSAGVDIFTSWKHTQHTHTRPRAPHPKTEPPTLKHTTAPTCQGSEPEAPLIVRRHRQISGSQRHIDTSLSSWSLLILITFLWTASDQKVNLAHHDDRVKEEKKMQPLLLQWYRTRWKWDGIFKFQERLEEANYFI